MSTASELKRRAGPQVRVQAASSNRLSSDGERLKLVLNRIAGRRPRDVFEVARLLVRAGVPVRSAKRAIDDLLMDKVAYVEAASVDDYESLRAQMEKENVATRVIRLCPVDVKNLRSRLGMSQEAFAGRYCLDVATLRNWEQARTSPEGPAATLLQLIDRDPDSIVELLASGPTPQRRVLYTAARSVEVVAGYPLAAEKYGSERLVAFTSKLRRNRSLFEFVAEEA